MGWVRGIGVQLDRLPGCRAYKEASGWDWLLLAGSRAEGLAVEEGWGHPETDIDLMVLYGEELGVQVCQDQAASADINLVYYTIGCPSAYCRLAVQNAPRLQQAIAKVEARVSQSEPTGCVFIQGSQQWLHAGNLLRLMQGDSISGPAGQDGNWDVVPTLVCSSSHPQMAAYCRRYRNGWPTAEMLHSLMRLPMLLVLTGHKLSQDSHLQLRVSWSHCEYLLVANLPTRIKQGYVAFKYVFKHTLSTLGLPEYVANGRSRIGSYHLKTVLLRHLEIKPPDMERSPFRLMLDLMWDLHGYLTDDRLPNYFLAGCDLLETVGDQEKKTALHAVQDILKNPIAAILQSPTVPQKIYGEVTPHDLVVAFNDVTFFESNQERHKSLKHLLHQLDEHRRACWEWLQVFDGNEVVGRPQLLQLEEQLNANVTEAAENVFQDPR